MPVQGGLAVRNMHGTTLLFRHFKLNDPDVIAKKERGIQYCAVASRWGKSNGYKEWRYLFIPAGQIRSNSSFEQLAERFKEM